MPALAVGDLLEKRSRLLLKRLVRTLKNYRTFGFPVAGSANPCGLTVADGGSSAHRPAQRLRDFYTNLS